MEAMVWLFFEIGGLLALAGIVFFILGWWSKGKLEPAEQNVVLSSTKPTSEGPSLADLALDAERQHWGKQISDLRSERDDLLIEVGQLRTRTEAPKPAAKPAKPRTRKSKK